MKFIQVLVYTFFLSSLNPSFGQTTSAQLGQRIFFAFKNDSLAIIESCRLRQDELASFSYAHGFDTTSNDFIRYKTKYSEITRKFFDRCKQIMARFSWKEAELVGIFLKDYKGNILPERTDTFPLVLEIRARSGDNPITLLFDTFIGTDNLWKFGNSISSTEGLALDTD